jgi:endonuclease/exonuclease/phosphatase (EEP) superfamily protein YafD
MSASRPSRPHRRWLPRILGLPLWGLAAATLAGFAGGWHWLVDLTAHFRWYWLLAALVWFALAGRWLGRGAILCLLVAVVGNAAAILPYWVPPEPGRTGGDPVRIVSLNLLVGNPDRQRAPAYLRDCGADVLVLLEVDDAWARALEQLADRYPHRLVEPRADSFGIAVLSRLPLVESRVVPLAGGPPVIAARVERDKAVFLLLAAHPPPPMSEPQAATRDAQLAAIGEVAAAAPWPVVVAGDLNTTPWSHAFRGLVDRGRLRDSALGRGVQGTWNARLWAPRIPIDHVLVAERIGVAARGVGPDVGSDHLPVEATLLLP